MEGVGGFGPAHQRLDPRRAARLERHGPAPGRGAAAAHGRTLVRPDHGHGVGGQGRGVAAGGDRRGRGPKVEICRIEHGSTPISSGRARPPDRATASRTPLRTRRPPQDRTGPGRPARPRRPRSARSRRGLRARGPGPSSKGSAASPRGTARRGWPPRRARRRPFSDPVGRRRRGDRRSRSRKGGTRPGFGLSWRSSGKDPAPPAPGADGAALS
ncbi:putative ChaX protein (plasmid) [Phenylobacterium zucineum HLK1]|uniref:Putative ChaX protein n=1 Tax=Phenylobacterium zucineum (strain HLK1) TaxID=450851 RepID=B4RI59_PHEZH|nr:putative ChaX protein [Phenylobacterium zucineum HLK1]